MVPKVFLVSQDRFRRGRKEPPVFRVLRASKVPRESKERPELLDPSAHRVTKVSKE